VQNQGNFAHRHVRSVAKLFVFSFQRSSGSLLAARILADWGEEFPDNFWPAYNPQNPPSPGWGGVRGGVERLQIADC
jgi:hypothetical protein